MLIAFRAGAAIYISEFCEKGSRDAKIIIELAAIPSGLGFIGLQPRS